MVFALVLKMEVLVLLLRPRVVALVLVLTKKVVFSMCVTVDSLPRCRSNCIMVHALFVITQKRCLMRTIILYLLVFTRIEQAVF